MNLKVINVMQCFPQKISVEVVNDPYKEGDLPTILSDGSEGIHDLVQA